MKRMLLLNTHLLRLLKGVAFYIRIFPETNRHTLFSYLKMAIYRELCQEGSS